MALAMIEGAERDGCISPGDTVVEYTGGGTGPALALVCQAKGYRAADRDRRLLHRGALPADARARGGDRRDPVGRGPSEGDCEGHRQHGRARRASSRAAPGHYATDQFNNPYIVPGHRDQLGREIWEQSEGRVTAFCQGMGTGELAHRRLGRAQAARRVHPGARAGGVGRDRRRRARLVPDPGLDRPRPCRTGIRPRSTASSRSATTRRSTMTLRLSARGGHLRRHLDRRERRRRASPGRAPRAGRGDRDARRRQRPSST